MRRAAGGAGRPGAGHGAATMLQLAKELERLDVEQPALDGEVGRHPAGAARLRGEVRNDGVDGGLVVGSAGLAGLTLSFYLP